MCKIKLCCLILFNLTLMISGQEHQHNENLKLEIVKFPGLSSLNSIYYDLKNNEPLKLSINETDKLTTRPLKIYSTGLPCSCFNLTCGCCAGMKIDFIKLNSTMCTNMTVVPEEFALDFHLLMDERVMIRNRLTARNPPPFCLPLYFFPIITFCVRLYDIVVLNSVLNICIDFETRIAGWPILVLHFDCIRIGQGELFLSKPFTNTTGYQIPLQIQFSKEPYDHVNFENDYNITYDTGLTIEQENQIGTLKID